MATQIANLTKLAKSSGLIAVVLTSPAGVFIDTDKLSEMELEDFKIAIKHVFGNKAHRIDMEPNYTGGMRVYPESPILKKKAVSKKSSKPKKVEEEPDIVKPLFICVSTGYDVQRLFENGAVEDFDENLIEDMTTGKPLYKTAVKALKSHRSLLSFMGISLDDEGDIIHDYIQIMAEDNKVEFDRWNPIFRCDTMIEALTMLPNIVKICRKLKWCNIWGEQEFDNMKTFPLAYKTNHIGTVIFLDLEAESG